MNKARTKSASAAPGATQPSPPPDRQLTCFVVTGFGNKTDYSTGRVLNLDKTYEQLVRPACDKVNVNCFRAIDANLTGSIDSIMYRWIYHADIVIADLSTLNANVFYELGVRHVQKPNTTVIIAESVLIQQCRYRHRLVDLALGVFLFAVLVGHHLQRARLVNDLVPAQTIFERHHLLSPQ